jgi:acyl carrier protein
MDDFMKLDKEAILHKVKAIFIEEIGFLKPEEVSYDDDIGSLKIDSDDISFFLESVEKEFEFDAPQSEWSHIITLEDIANLVIKYKHSS